MTYARKNNRWDVIRLGYEMLARGYSVWEHPLFGGVNPRYHIPNSKHNPDPAKAEAIDLNWNPKVPTSREEDDRFDRMALELDRRLFGVIWNRGNFPGDHSSHLHAETRGNPEQYKGRYRLKRAVKWRRLTEDGTWGKQTTLALQEWLGTPATGGISKRGSTVIKALQRFLNTEARETVLKADGTMGPLTIKQLQKHLGTPQTGKYSKRGSTMVREMQRRLNDRGHL